MRLLAAALLSLLALPLAAEAAPATKGKGDIVIHVGEYSVLRDHAHRSTEAGVEYRFRDQYHGLRPTVGALANDDGATYAYAGINWDLPIKAIAPFVITPGIVAGGYSQGDSKDLGYGLEFRSSLEVTYKFKDGQRLGAAISHLSNASLGNKNPGTETLQIVYSHPLSF